MQKIIFCLLILMGCEKATPPMMPTPAVKVVEVVKKEVPRVFEAVGTVESSHMVDIRARVEGYLDKIAYVEGSRVKTGDLLFQIDPRPFQAEVASAKAELSANEAILWDASKIRKRLEPLYKEHAISERDLDNAIARELTAIAAVEGAKAKLWMAELNLDYTTITAPIDGVTSKANYREGALITQMLKDPLTTVSATDPVWINFSISENVILSYQKEVTDGYMVGPQDQKFMIELILADGSVYPYLGEVSLLQPFYNEATGTLEVRTTFQNPDILLKPNQFVDVRVLGAKYKNVFVVPKTAVVQGSRGPFVYIVDKEGIVETVLVELGPWWQEEWIIKGGLKEGDHVIYEGVNKVQKGIKVRVL
jgi:membrane fusion protein (multidrug efflux system)